MNIPDQIEALTQELRPKLPDNTEFYYFDGEVIDREMSGFLPVSQRRWYVALFASTNKAEVEEYADCYRRLKLYQLLGDKKKKEFPLHPLIAMHGTDFTSDDFEEQVLEPGHVIKFQPWQGCVLGGVWFSREEDRLAALKICGIDAEFQKRCAKYGLGGA
jgi:hypothetical protein